MHILTWLRNKFKKFKFKKHLRYTLQSEVEKIVQDIKDKKYREANIQYSKFYYSQSEIQNIKEYVNAQGLNYILSKSQSVDVLRIF